MKKTAIDPILAGRVPKKLRKDLDTAAKQSGRSRSAEMRIRLEHSLREFPVLAKAA